MDLKEQYAKENNTEPHYLTQNIYEANKYIEWLEKRLKAGQHETIVIGKKDLHTMRQWFNCIEDVHPKYLEKRDYELVKRVYEALNLPVRDALIEKCQ